MEIFDRVLTYILTPGFCYKLDLLVELVFH
jgi:hypothetical protein